MFEAEEKYCDEIVKVLTKRYGYPAVLTCIQDDTLEIMYMPRPGQEFKTVRLPLAPQGEVLNIFHAIQGEDYEWE